MKPKNYGIFFMVFLLGSCAAKKAPMRNESIRTVQKLNIGLLDLSPNDYSESAFYECAKELQSTVILSRGATEKKLLDQGITKESFIQTIQSQNFDPYSNIHDFSLLIFMFKNKENINYVRLVNFLSKQTRTVMLAVDQFNCENIFTALRMITIDSHPPLADIYIDDRLIGEAPLWTSLKDGMYDLQCKLPGHVFSKTKIEVPGKIQYLCQRENQVTMGMEDEDENSSFLEKSQNWFLYIFAGAASIGVAILPFLLF